MIIHTDRNLLAAIHTHAKSAGILTIARAYEGVTRSGKTMRVMKRHLGTLKRNKSADAHLAAAALQELINRRLSVSQLTARALRLYR